MLTTVLSELIAFKSVSGYQSETAACFHYLEEFLAARSMHVKRHACKGFPSIVATTRDTKRPKIMLQAHLDVVPASDGFFTMKEADGKLYGRGVFDMKFAAACFLQLVDDLHMQLAKYDFGLMLTSDEEAGGDNGVGHLLTKGYGTDICILPDAGNNWEIECARNGVWVIRVMAKGVSAHGSRPWEGKNAIDQLIRAIKEIKAVFGPHVQSAEHCSITVSQIEGGAAINQVPDRAEATLDMRFIDMEHYRSKRAKIEQIVEQQGLNYTAEVEVEPAKVDLANSHIAHFMQLAEATSGRAIGQRRSCGSSDSRFFTALGIPTILMRPSGGGDHSEGEWIDKAELLQFYEVIKAYVTQEAKI